MTTRSDIQSEIQSQAATLGLATVYFGNPQPEPVNGFPYGVVTFGEPQYERLSFGLGGSIQETYDVTIKIVYGKVDTRPSIAEAASLAYADKMRSVFSNGIGAGEFFSEVVSGTDNMQTYFGVEAPASIYRLSVQEIKAANASAG